MTPSRAAGNCSTSVLVKCALFTSLKIDEDGGRVVYKCLYSAWAYSLFALVGIILVLLPLVLLLCCIFRRRSKRRQYIRSESTTYSINDPECPYQPLADDAEVFTNYGAVGNDPSHRENNKDERNRHRESGSIASSHASLLPNFDETSLNARNALITSKQLLSDSNRNKPTTPNQFYGRTNSASQPISESGLYATVDLVPDLSTSSPPGNSRGNSKDREPIYDLVESPTSDNIAQTSASAALPKHVNNAYAYNIAPIAETDKVNSQVKENFPSPYLLDGPSSSNSSAATVREEKKAVAEPFYEPENQNLLNVPKNGANAVCNDVKVSECEPRNIMGEDNSICNSPRKCKPLAEQMEPILDSASTGKDQEEDCTTAASTMIQNCITDSCSDDESISEAKQLRKKLESREDYEMFLLDEVKKLPENERQGCYLIRDSLTSPGCKVLTMYAATLKSDQKVFNFKVCIGQDGCVYLAKSKRKFSVIDALLSYLKVNKDMLPCTITRQFINIQGEDNHLYEEVVA